MSQYPNVKFMLGARQPRQFPEDLGVEVALVGRSNSGKSSALNALMGRRSLARTSKTPGQTREINFFEIEPGRRLVDLPGYGFARVPGQVQEQWRELIKRYFEARSSLKGVIVIMDARHPLKDLDRQMLDWAGARELRTHLLLTKSDKLSRDEGLRALRYIQAETAQIATAQLFSAVTRVGLEEARMVLTAMLQETADENSVARIEYI